MKNIVITGSSRGIGFGLAREFLLLGHRVIISGRNGDTLKEAVRRLQSECHTEHVVFQVADIAREKDIQDLWAKAAAFGPVDIWINNAGTGQETRPLVELKAESVINIINTNITGLILASKIAMEKMTEQGFGAIYNMEGFGSDGRKMKNMIVYGTSKSAVRYFSKSLAMEAEDTPVLIGTISPGMVVTDLLTGPISDDRPINKEAIRIFNILADTVETVTPFLVKKMLSNNRNGYAVNWLTGRKVMFRFIKNIFVKRKVDGLPKI